MEESDKVAFLQKEDDEDEGLNARPKTDAKILADVGDGDDDGYEDRVDAFDDLFGGDERSQSRCSSSACGDIVDPHNNIIANELRVLMGDFEGQRDLTEEDLGSEVGEEEAEEASQPDESVSAPIDMIGDLVEDDDADIDVRMPEGLDINRSSSPFSSAGSKHGSQESAEGTNGNEKTKGDSKAIEETWDYSLKGLKSDTDRSLSKQKNKILFIEGPFYYKLREDCYHEVHNVYCDCEEKIKVSTCRLCNKVFCSTNCYRRAMPGYSAKENEKKEKVEPEAEISQTVEPECPDEAALARSCAHPQLQQSKEVLKRSTSKELDLKGKKETNYKIDKGGRGGVGFKDKKGQQHNSSPGQKLQHAGKGQPPHTLWPSQVQRNNINTVPFEAVSNFTSAPPPQVQRNNANKVPFEAHSNFTTAPPPQVQRNNANKVPFEAHSNFTTAPPPQVQRNNANKGPFEARSNFTSFPPPPIPTQMFPNNGNMNPMMNLPVQRTFIHGGNEYGAISTGNDRMNPIIGHQYNPGVNSHPVRILRNPRAMEKSNDNSDNFNRNQLKCGKNGDEFATGFKSSNFSTFKANASRQSMANQTNHHQQHTSPEHPRNVSQGAKSSFSESSFCTAATHPSQSDTKKSAKSYQQRQDLDLPCRQKPRSRGNSEDYKEFPLRNRSESSGYRDRKDGYKFGIKPTCTPAGRREQQQTPQGSASVMSDPAMGNSLNYSASHGRGQSKKWAQPPSLSSTTQQSLSQQSIGSSGGSSSSTSPKKKSNTLFKITLGPDMPFGLRLPVKYVSGKSFLDFSVMTVKNVDLFKILHSNLQEAEKVKMDFFEPEGFCAVPYKEDEDESPKEWYRGIITKVLGNVGVYLVDLGVLALVPKESVFELPEEFKMYRPYAIRFRCLNVQLDNSGMTEILEYFESLVCQTTVKIRVTHKDELEPHTYAGTLEVQYIGKWFDVGPLLEKLELGEMRTEQDISADEWSSFIKPLPGANSGVPDLAMPYSANSTTEFSVVLTRIVSLNEFYVTTLDLINKRNNLEQELCSQGVANSAAFISCLQDLSYPLFMMIDSQTERWIRVKVLEVSPDLRPVSAVVFKMDYGETLTVPLANLKQLPTKFHVEGCIYKCSLPVSEKSPLKGRNAPAASEEPVRYLTSLCENEVPVNFRLFVVDDMKFHVGELFLENSKEGCTYSLVKRGLVAMSSDVDLKQCVRA